MYTASDLRKGLKLAIDGEPYIVTDFEFSKPGKGQALYKTRLKNLLTGNAFERTFRSNDKFEKADLTERTMQFLYSQGDEFVFMDTKNYEQITSAGRIMEDKIPFLIDNMEVQVLLFGERPIDITLPNTVVLTVTEAMPWAKGDTSGNDYQTGNPGNGIRLAGAAVHQRRGQAADRHPYRPVHHQGQQIALPAGPGHRHMLSSATLWQRARFIQTVRTFFVENGYLEADTPIRIPAPAPEAHIEPVAADGWYLQTSPELCMKRLLAAGERKIFQICKCFRAHERGRRHLPEFTMLEWYRAGISYRELMAECEKLVRMITQKAARPANFSRKIR